MHCFDGAGSVRGAGGRVVLGAGHAGSRAHHPVSQGKLLVSPLTQVATYACIQANKLLCSFGVRSARGYCSLPQQTPSLRPCSRQ